MLRIVAALAGASLALGASTAFGADIPAPDPLPLDYVAHRLAALGQHLRAIRPQG
ncbi:MAG TPA: hypothetical protein VD978_33920 [Azospirillum sp.]|nr:hypothetical protein [Azospirillum sp.]